MSERNGEHRAAPLRVAYVTMLFPAGSETFACLDVRELGRKGLEVAVHSLRPPNGDVERLARERGLEGVERTYNGWAASARGLGSMLAEPGLSARYLWRLVRLMAARPRELLKSLVLLPRAYEVLQRLRRDRPDVVHVYWGHYPSLVGALVQEHLPSTVVSISLGAYDLVAEYPLSTVVAQRAEFVRTHGHANVAELVERVGVAEERVAVVFNGIDLDLAPATLEPGPRVPGRVVTAGRLVAKKAVDDVLRAFGEVRAQVPHATLEVFGDGPERGHLEKLVHGLGMTDSVTFRGHQGQRELFAALARAEVFLFMSRSPSERLPNVVKEAMACGAVCVSAESVGLDELIPGPDHGVVVAQGDVDAAARAVVDLLRDPDRARTLRQNARRYVTEHFDVRRTTDAYLERWRAAAARRSTGTEAVVVERPAAPTT